MIYNFIGLYSKNFALLILNRKATYKKTFINVFSYYLKLEICPIYPRIVIGSSHIYLYYSKFYIILYLRPCLQIFFQLRSHQNLYKIKKNYVHNIIGLFTI